MKKLIVLALAALCASCGSSSSPSSPSTATTATTTTATGPWTLSGTITSAAGGGIAGATIKVVDGPNAGQSTQTDGAGAYSIRLNQAGFTISITAPGFVTATRSVTLTANTTSSAALLPSQLFTQTGVGDNVFTIPGYVTKVRVDASYQGTCQNFIVNANSRLLINIIIGTCSVADTRSPFSGTYAITGTTPIAITSSTGIAWTFTELR